MNLAKRTGLLCRMSLWTGYRSTTGRTLMAPYVTVPSHNVTVKHVAPSISLYRVTRNEQDMMDQRGKPQTTVLFFPFLYAPQKATDQYRELYLSRGMDVISISGDLKYFMWPPSGKRLATRVLDYLVSNELPLKVDHLFVHSMSIGCYIWALILMEASVNPHKYGSLLKKVNGQVFDSMTIGGVDRMVSGVANKAGNPVSYAAIKYSAMLFFMLTKPYTRNVHSASLDVFKAMPVTAPVLVYYAMNDPMSAQDAVEDMVTTWRAHKRFDVHTKCWERSLHSAHMREHPEQYVKTLQSFLQLVGIQPFTSKL